MDLIGERFVYGPADPEAFLRQCGLICASDVTAGEYLHTAFAADVDDRQRIARIDQVRVLDLGILEPDFGPVPGIAQKYGRDIP